MEQINPSHYKKHPSGVECIKIARHFNFCLGNAFKYIWRAGIKTTDPREDLRKAIRYLEEEIERWTTENLNDPHRGESPSLNPLPEKDPVARALALQERVLNLIAEERRKDKSVLEITKDAYAQARAFACCTSSRRKREAD